jgi:nicotinic acetylcholine receptor
MVLDRLFLWIFLLAVVAGTAGIILQAPSLYDDRQPIDRIYSEIHKAITRSANAEAAAADEQPTPAA